MITLIERIKENIITYQGEEYLLSSDMQDILSMNLFAEQYLKIAQEVKYYPIGYSRRVYCVKVTDLFEKLNVDNSMLANNLNKSIIITD